MTKVIKQSVGAPPVISDRVILSLRENPNQTLGDLGASYTVIRSLRDRGFIRISGLRSSGKRGRPQMQFSLALQGFNRVRSIEARNKQRSAVAA